MSSMDFPSIVELPLRISRLSSWWEFSTDVILPDLLGDELVNFSGLKALRLVRITRIVKVARLARVLRFVMALRTLISSIIYTLPRGER